jgi:putative ABC transport system permease protein
VTAVPRPPRLARALVRLCALGRRRSDLEADLQDVYTARVAAHGLRYARRRFYADVWSVWWRPLRRTEPGARWSMRLGQGARDALRLWRARPGLTALAVVTLALASGAAMLCFSLLDAIAFKPLPVSRPEQLVAISAVDAQGQEHGLAPRALQALGSRQQVLSVLCGYGETWLPVTIRSQQVQSAVETVSGAYFDLVGIHALMGRLLEPTDDGPKPAATRRVAVLGERFWRNRFAADANVVGTTVVVAGEPLTIVGVAPESFVGMQIEVAPDVVIPLQTLAAYLGTAPDSMPYPYVLGRLRAGGTAQRAQAALEAMWPSLMAQTVAPSLDGHARQQALNRRPIVTSVTTGFSFLRPQYQASLRLLTALAGWMLLTAGVSLAGLLVARAIARAPELRMRVALGASRADLARQIVVESACLAIAGTLAGLLLARWAAPILLGLLHPSVQHMTVNLAIDWRVAAASLGLATAIAIVLSLAPAWIASRVASLSASAHARTVTTSYTRWSEGLLAAQLAVSLMLVIGAGLFVRTLVNLSDTNLGFDSHGLLAVWLQPKADGYRGMNDLEYYPALLADLSSIPGVRSAALLPALPFGGGTGQSTVTPSATPPQPLAPLTDAETVSPGFFGAVGVPLIRGRDFTWHDTPESPRVALLSESLATRLFPQGDAIGHQVRVGAAPTHQAVAVVGIVGDIRFNDAHAPATPTIYLSKAQELHLEWPIIALRTTTGATTIEAEIRRRIEAFGRENVYSLRDFETMRHDDLMRERLAAYLGGAFGGLAVLLAAIGAFGLVSQSVARRTRELGLRLALGASPAGLGQMVLRQAVRLAVIGTALGLPAAWAAARLVDSELYGVTTHDPMVFGTAIVALVSIVVLAAWAPARRAVRLSPLDALRVD